MNETDPNASLNREGLQHEERDLISEEHVFCFFFSFLSLVKF